MFGGKYRKALTFSYDDGVTQDIRLIALFDKYGVKGTFNLNSGLLGQPGELLREGKVVSHRKNRPDEVRQIYARHEVAGHTLTHPNLTQIVDPDEVVRQAEEDRLALSALVGYEVRGFAYPCGGINHDRRVETLLRERTGIRYARTIESSGGFALPSDPYALRPTVCHHHGFEEMMRLGRQFVAAEPEEDMLFYVWGHAYEFDIFDDWDRMERFLALVSGRDDVFYGTNSECLL